MTFVFRHPNYYKQLKKQNDLTNKSNYGKENHDEKIQSNTKRHGTIRNRNTIIQKRTDSE